MTDKIIWPKCKMEDDLCSELRPKAEDFDGKMHNLNR